MQALVSATALKAATKLLGAPHVDPDAVDTLVPRLISILSTESKPSEVKRGALLALKAVAKEHHDLLEPFVPRVVPVVFACVRDRTIPVKLAAERALVYVFGLKKSLNIPNVSSERRCT